MIEIGISSDSGQNRYCDASARDQTALVKSDLLSTKRSGTRSGRDIYNDVSIRDSVVDPDIGNRLIGWIDNPQCIGQFHTRSDGKGAAVFEDIWSICADNALNFIDRGAIGRTFSESPSFHTTAATKTWARY